MAKKKLLNLDELISDEVVIILKGKEHKLKEATLNDFLINAKAIEKVGKAASLEEEMQIGKGILLRSFPSLTSEDIDDLTMPQINKLIAFARDANGEEALEDQAKAEVEKSGGNPPIAGEFGTLTSAS